MVVKWQCIECGATFDTPSERDNHIRADHAKYKHWCHLCLCAFKHLDTLERHERNHHLYHRHGFGSGAGERNF
ncbi:hypothetical protein BU14_0185s0026 [Porphyra umbilicalis]|uniref:C2H2-type domain-containing protein n=1 Tax=Porphyra umbilicalis TaxID=2786 RepID=A0A1X6P721_PORUM|nr:hypothetical protein BU14_0185s0026 [Porphyra umbilicalis]|eukprot:OSX76566.1 hypothetical protein BU14_0185s0026 [Porphyra umbilicalis]